MTAKLRKKLSHTYTEHQKHLRKLIALHHPEEKDETVTAHVQRSFDVNYNRKMVYCGIIHLKKIEG